MRRTALTVCVMLAGATAYGACADDTDDTTTTTTGTTNGAATSTGAAGAANARNPPTVRLSDPEIASVSMTANMGEVQQNMFALTRVKRDDLRNFAQDMVDMHRAALQREMQLAQSMNVTPADNAMSQMLKSNSDKMMQMLQAASDDDFDNLYIRSQVDAHQMVLQIIEGSLMPSAQAQPIQTELGLMRQTVMMHLERARDLADAG